MRLLSLRRVRRVRRVRLASLAFALAAGLAALGLAPTDARACGGCFHPPPSPTESPSVVTDHRMAIAIAPTMTTLWDQIEYAGDPKDFAWVLPIHGAVAVGVGNASFMDALDQRTAPLVHGPQPTYCPVSGGGGVGCGGATSDTASLGYAPTADDAGVVITAQATVGPYDTVQLHGASGAPILAWLTSHGYAVPAAIEPVLAQYVSEGFDFLAVRLAPNVGVRAMRPIRVSWSGADPRLPLRMVAAGVGDVVGIKLFVVSDGRWHTKNFPTASIDASALTWDFAAEKSDYVETRNAVEAAAGGRAWIMESSVDVSPYAITLTPDPQDPPFDLDAGVDGAPADAPSDVLGDALEDAGGADASDAAADAPVADAPAAYDAGQPPAVTPDMSDVEIAFGNKASQRVTRLRADLPSKYLDADLELEADATQAALAPDLYVTKSTNAAVCPGDSSACVVGSGERRAPLRAPAGIAVAVALAAFARRVAKRR